MSLFSDGFPMYEFISCASSLQSLGFSDPSLNTGGLWSTCVCLLLIGWQHDFIYGPTGISVSLCTVGCSLGIGCHIPSHTLFCLFNLTSTSHAPTCVTSCRS